jgi:hypothetical protein
MLSTRLIPKCFNAQQKHNGIHTIKLGKSQAWGSTGFYYWTFAFSNIYINDMTALINNKSTPVLFADDTSISMTHSDFTGFKNNINTVLETLNNWFNNNFLCLNFEKTQFTHFSTKNNKPNNIQIGVDNKILPNVTYIKFFGLL